MSDLTRFKFSGLQLCKLVGISHHQFQSFKQAGLIDNKPKYNIDEIIYIFITNFFREQNKSWSTIKIFYNDIFGINKINKIPFIKIDSIIINFEKKSYNLIVKSNEKINFISPKLVDMSELEAIKIIESITVFEQKLFEKNFNGYCIHFENNFTVFDINLVLKEIVKNSEKLHLKIDLKKALNVA